MVDTEINYDGLLFAPEVSKRKNVQTVLASREDFVEEAKNAEENEFEW